MTGIPNIPGFTNCERIAEQLVIGMLADSPALLCETAPGDKPNGNFGGMFVRLSAPQAKRLADKIKELAA